jgi:hypothetical protein
MLSKKLTEVHGLLYFEFCSVVDEKIASSLLTLLWDFQDFCCIGTLNQEM